MNTSKSELQNYVISAYFGLKSGFQFGRSHLLRSHPKSGVTSAKSDVTPDFAEVIPDSGCDLKRCDLPNGNPDRNTQSREVIYQFRDCIIKFEIQKSCLDDSDYLEAA